MCIRYNSEIVTVQSIVQTQPLGLLYLIQNEFKNTALPEPKRLQDITKDVIPWLVAVNWLNCVVTKLKNLGSGEPKWMS